MKRIFGLLLVLYIMLFALMSYQWVPAVHAIDRVPGVAPGQYLHYEIHSVWYDGNDTELESWLSNQPYTGMHVIVLSVANISVTFYSVLYNSTGIVYNLTQEVDVENSHPRGDYSFIASNLTVGDLVYTNDKSTWINDTAVASYLGQQLEVNHHTSLVYRSSLSFVDFPASFNAAVSQDFYWHRQSGILLETEFEFSTNRTFGEDVLVGHFLQDIVATISAPPVVPEFLSFLVLPLFMVTILLAIPVCRRKQLL